MCGRYALTAVTINFPEQFGVVELPDMPVADRYNIAPTQPVLIVRENRESGSGKRELTHVVWGLIPPWCEGPAMGARMINARAETAAEKPAFRHALKRRRCLLPVSGFYEWKHAPNGETRQAESACTEDLFGDTVGPVRETAGPGQRASMKIPHYIRMADGKPFAFGGLWEVWSGPNGELIESCAILTTQANELIGSIHDRMPVIVRPQDYSAWLDPLVQDVNQIQRFLKSYDAETMEAYPVSRKVNSPSNDGVDLTHLSYN